jgi:2-polyprenyl-6-methoxyphenol hydroxylase-like FAD-dependent oxidoreductase
MPVQRVLVVGAGVGGVALGAALGSRGVEVDIVEVKPDSSVYGVGINQPANSLRALRSLGVLEGCLDAGYQFDRTRFNDRHGNLIVDVPSFLGGDDVPANNALSRIDLQRLLLGAADKAGAKISYATTLTNLEEEGDTVQVDLSDGRTGAYDLVVGFDGIKSPTRPRLFGPGAEPAFSGFSVWRLTVPRPDDITCPEMFQGIGTKAGVIPLNQRDMYLLFVSPEPDNPRLDPDHFGDLLRERLQGYSGLIGDLRASISGPDGIVYSPLSEILLPAPWYHGRTIVLGDAAHACAPHLTQGAAMALEDAVVLADELEASRPLEVTLDAFMARRYGRCKLVQDVSHNILVSEMAVTAETMEATLSGMRDHMVENMAGVHGALDQPA